MLLINENRVVTWSPSPFQLSGLILAARVRGTQKERNVQYCGNERIPTIEGFPQLVRIESHLDRHRDLRSAKYNKRASFPALRFESARRGAEVVAVRSAAII